jgi:hypothetical protein
MTSRYLAITLPNLGRSQNNRPKKFMQSRIWTKYEVRATLTRLVGKQESQ